MDLGGQPAAEPAQRLPPARSAPLSRRSRAGSQAPGKFFPYWTLTRSCALEFGNMTNGNTFGKQAQYGTIVPALGYPELLGPIMPNPCA